MEVLHHWQILPTTKRVGLIRKKAFAIEVLDSEHKVFMIYITALSINSGDEMYPLKRAWIAYQKIDKALTKVLSEYTDYVDLFLTKLAVKLSKYTGINNLIIKLVDD